MRRTRLALVTVVSFMLVSACTSTDPEVTFELACDAPVGMVAAELADDFQGNASPEDAIEAIRRDLPAGDWIELNESQWVVVDGDGRTVGHATIRVVTENRVETFPEDRYLIEDVEWCDPSVTEEGDAP